MLHSNQATQDLNRNRKVQNVCKSIYIYIYLFIFNRRQYCFGLLGLISAMLMSGMEVKFTNPPQMSHTCGTSKPCQSAQTSELVSMRNC